MVIYIMGAPRAKNGAHTSRPILGRCRYITYPSCHDFYPAPGTVAGRAKGPPSPSAFRHAGAQAAMVFTSEDPLGLALSGASTPHSRTTKQFISLRRTSEQEGEESSIDCLIEVHRQKRVLLQASLGELNDKVECFLLDVENVESEGTPPESLISSWRGQHNTTPSRSNLLVASYIHESRKDMRRTPCRNDLLYAAETNTSPNPFIVNEETIQVVFRVPTLSFAEFWKIEWDECVRRDALMVQEGRVRGMLSGSEVAQYLSLLRNYRRSFKFHESNSSSLGAIRRKEKQYHEEGFAHRLKRIAAEHRNFISCIPPERLPPLRLPSVGKGGRSYKITPVDYEVARALAVEEKILRVVKAGKNTFFPGIL